MLVTLQRAQCNAEIYVRTCTAIMAVKPRARYLPNRSGAAMAMRKPRQIKIKKEDDNRGAADEPQLFTND